MTTGFCGLLRDHGDSVYDFVHRGMASRLRVGGLLARSRMLERIRLSPEGASAGDLVRVSRDLHAAGCQVYSLTYHSPSLVPGHTPYVRSERDLARFIGAIDEYCRFFRDELGGVFMSLSQLYALLREQCTPTLGLCAAP